MRISSILLLPLLLVVSLSCAAQNFDEQFIEAVNNLRQTGCRCAGKNMPSVGIVRYNRLLRESAYIQAEEIRSQRRLNHYSRAGLNIGERISKVGYRWHVVGENLAHGQISIGEVISDWIGSKSHCLLLMDNRFDEIGFAKIGDYWVLHFGKQKKNR